MDSNLQGDSREERRRKPNTPKVQPLASLHNQEVCEWICEWIQICKWIREKTSTNALVDPFLRSCWYLLLRWSPRQRSQNLAEEIIHLARSRPKREKPYSEVCRHANACMSIAIFVRATHLCLRGSRIPEEQNVQLPPAVGGQSRSRPHSPY